MLDKGQIKGQIDSSVTKVKIADGVTEINESAFRDCYKIAEAIIPSSVRFIGDGAFYNCENLTSIDIPDNVFAIGHNCFENCYKLSNVDFGSCVKYIGDSAFNHCKSLTSIELPNSVESIGENTFIACAGLTSVKLGDGVKSIGKEAFRGCNKVQKFFIPKTVELIGDGAFGGISSAFTEIEVEENNPYFFTIPGEYYLIQNDDTLVCYLDAPKADATSAITTYRPYAFYNCKGLTEVFINNTVTEIPDYAFYGCSNLERIIFRGTEEQWNAIEKGKKWLYACNNSNVQIIFEPNF